jgi:uncharacterized iron-regulated protein
MQHLYCRALTVLLPLVVLAGCSTVGLKQGAVSPEASASFKVGDIVDTKTGKILPVDSLMEQLTQARIIYVGETHTSVEDHRVQMELFRKLLGKNPHLILAMEMFPRRVQPILDQYRTGALSEELFLKDVQWNKIWGYPFRLYGPIMAAARTENLRIIGLNAPHEVVSKIAQGGLASLSPEERSQVGRDFHLDEPGNRARVQEEYVQHMRGEIKEFETFYEAQLAWEETMAETLAETLKTLPDDGRILVLIGKGHMTKRLGIPYLTAKRVDHVFKTVAPVPIDYFGNISDPNIADVVWVTDKAESYHKGRLGLMVKALDEGRGLEVIAVVAGGPAQRAGILKGDVIFMIDAVPVKSLDDLHRAMTGEGVKDHAIHLRRGKQDISVPVSLSP